MTLGRLVLAWLPVVVWCALGAWAKGRVTTNPISPVATLRRSAIEAGLLTLFASLWFDSLGAGSWWLLFGLVGALVALAGRPASPAPSPQPPRTAILHLLGDILRYIGAGAILAWRLGS